MDGERQVLRLYIAGTTPQSARAVVSIRDICDHYLAGGHELEVIDLFKNPEKAREGQIIAVPTLVRQSPLPVKRFIGDLSDPARIIEGLGLGEN